MSEVVKIKIKPIYEPHEINEAKEALKWAMKNDPDIAARWSRAYKIMGQALARTAFERAAKNKIRMRAEPVDTSRLPDEVPV
ncbi:hypothetical protein JOC37_001353 [Desulfohalotomaculum tongense]|uniref:hypothetical protein n=1 Tax=Desulforadius tongensis TaxID=1216062 RepID=UPI00195BF992|nr:hypothetical protein [Desulforadius tongensis]MBM7854973.1 hypothetical protein [Desulforadius tongensis]